MCQGHATYPRQGGVWRGGIKKQERGKVIDSHAAPRSHFHRIHDELHVHHFGSNAQEVAHHPHVGSHLKPVVCDHVQDGAHDDHHEAQPAPSRRQRLAQEPCRVLLFQGTTGTADTAGTSRSRNAFRGRLMFLYHFTEPTRVNKTKREHDVSIIRGKRRDACASQTP